MGGGSCKGAGPGWGTRQRRGTQEGGGQKSGTKEAPLGLRPLMRDVLFPGATLAEVSVGPKQWPTPPPPTCKHRLRSAQSWKDFGKCLCPIPRHGSWGSREYRGGSNCPNLQSQPVAELRSQPRPLLPGPRLSGTKFHLPMKGDDNRDENILGLLCPHLERNLPPSNLLGTEGGLQQRNCQGN